MRTCSLCERALHTEFFGRRTKNTSKGYCKVCQQLYHKYVYYPIAKDRMKDAAWRCTIKKKFNMVETEYHAMLEGQEGKCAVCGTDDPATANRKHTHFCIDHCHTTGRVRGLLCDYCNNLLGRARDNTEVLKSAIIYLNKEKV